jgi:hypothetical protein
MLLSVGVFLKVPKRQCRLAPLVKTERDQASQIGGFQNRLIDCHVPTASRGWIDN